MDTNEKKPNKLSGGQPDQKHTTPDTFITRDELDTELKQFKKSIGGKKNQSSLYDKISSFIKQLLVLLGILVASIGLAAKFQSDTQKLFTKLSTSINSQAASAQSLLFDCRNKRSKAIIYAGQQKLKKDLIATTVSDTLTTFSTYERSMFQGNNAS